MKVNGIEYERRKIWGAFPDGRRRDEGWVFEIDRPRKAGLNPAGEKREKFALQHGPRLGYRQIVHVRTGMVVSVVPERIVGTRLAGQSEYMEVFMAAVESFDMSIWQKLDEPPNVMSLPIAPGETAEGGVGRHMTERDILDMAVQAFEEGRQCGFCEKCGTEVYGIEPDTGMDPEAGNGPRVCHGCGARAVYGAETIVVRHV